MAIKKEKQQVSYQNKIGVVNRGSGVATAANNASRQAQIFDTILNQQADENLKRLQERGERLGKERANKTNFESAIVDVEVDGEMQSVNVPVFPENTPSGMGLTEAKVYEKNIVSLYNARMKTDIDTEIRNASNDALMSNSSPDLFDKDIDNRLKPFFEAMPDGSHSEMMKTYAQERKDIHGYKVFTNDRNNKLFNAKAQQKYQALEVETYITNRYKNKKITKEELLDIVDIDSLKAAGIDTTTILSDIDKQVTGANLAHEFFKEYPILKSPNDVNKLNKLVTGRADSIEIQGKTVTQEDLLKYLDNPITNKIISTDLKNIDIFNNETFTDTVTRQGFDNDIDNLLTKIIDGERVTTTMSGNQKAFGKIYKKNRQYYDEKISAVLVHKGIEPTEINKFSYLVKLGYTDPMMVSQIQSVLRQPSADGIKATLPYMKIINQRGMEDKSYIPEGMILRHKRQLSLFVSLHKQTNGSNEEVAELYSGLKDKLDNTGDITQVILSNIQTTSNVNSMAALMETVKEKMQGMKDVFSYDIDYLKEVQNGVQLKLLTGQVITKDDDYVPMIEEAMNEVVAYDKKYSEDYTTAPAISSDEILVKKTDPNMQRTRISKYGALGYYGVNDSQINSKLSTETHIHYVHDLIINEIKTASVGPNGTFETENAKKRFIKKLNNNKGTKEFFYQDERTDSHVQLMPISGYYTSGQTPDYHIGIWNPALGTYQHVPTDAGTLINITSDEFDDEREKYINKLDSEKHG